MNQIEINKIEIYKTWKGGEEQYEMFCPEWSVNDYTVILPPSQMKELKEKINKLDI